MKNTFKTLTSLLIICTAFTACTKEKAQPSPISFPYPTDVRDAAVGVFEATLGADTIQFEFVKHDSIQDRMEILDVVEGDGRQGMVASIIDIVKTEDGFDYIINEDNATGTYNKFTDIHTFFIPSEAEDWIFSRVY